MRAVDDVVLRAVAISKSYGVTQALKGVDFEVRRGKVTALFGENGAGKSTLMKVLSGVESPTSGQLELDGRPITLGSTNDAVELGISIIHQELNLFPNLNVRDNIFVGRELRSARGIDYGREEAVTRELMDRFGEDIQPGMLVGELRLGQQQIVEIARALATDARILIMDEPTSALSAGEVAALFKVIRELAARGVHPGELMTIASRRGQVSLYARADDGTPRGTVFVAFCWYEAAINKLTNPALDPVAKIPEFKYCAVRVCSGGVVPERGSFGGGRTPEA